MAISLNVLARRVRDLRPVALPMWIVSTPTRAGPLIVGALLSGITRSGVTLTQASRLMEQTPNSGLAQR